MKVLTVLPLLLLTQLAASSGFGAIASHTLSGSGQTMMSSGSPVEPSLWLMLLGGFGLLWMLMRFRRYRV